MADHRKLPLSTRELPEFGPVIPVIVIDELAHAVPMAKALVAGGVRVLEVTLRTPVAIEAMRAIMDAVPEAVVGAGTIRSIADAQRCVIAGCAFGVTPGYASDIGRACKTLGLPLLPGVSTASELMQANADGYDFLKFFPAEAAGGVNMLKSLGGPFPDVMFCPTGGITVQTAPSYLALRNVVVCGGSWLTPIDAMRAGDWARITQLAREATALRAPR
jgi:2-dehydro-3-deoxyphosphogluconate aldolase/(4S)-4-hydroxy-2-oxoglutarate aldolase